jgi:hypothetical protein
LDSTPLFDSANHGSFSNSTPLQGLHNHFRNRPKYVEVEVTLRPTVSQPACPGVRRPSGTWDEFCFLLEISFRLLRVCYFVAPSLTRGRVCNLIVQLLLGLARAVACGSKSRRTHDNILLSHLRLPQPGEPGSRIYIPPEQDGPVITPPPPGTGSTSTSTQIRLTVRWQEKYGLRASAPWTKRPAAIYPTNRMQTITLNKTTVMLPKRWKTNILRGAFWKSRSQTLIWILSSIVRNQHLKLPVCLVGLSWKTLRRDVSPGINSNTFDIEIRRYQISFWHANQQSK